MTKKSDEKLIAEKVAWLRRTVRDADLQRTEILAAKGRSNAELEDATTRFRKAMQGIADVEQYLGAWIPAAIKKGQGDVQG
jgi:hypothetical protein